MSLPINKLGLDGFKKFILRGNVIDLAVGIVIGASFTSVINALVKDLITPLIAAIGGEPDFSKIAFSIRGSQFLVGDFLNTFISFLINAAVIYYLVISPLSAFLERLAHNSKQKEVEVPTIKECPECLSEIPLAAKRCAFCTVEQK